MISYQLLYHQTMISQWTMLTMIHLYDIIPTTKSSNYDITVDNADYDILGYHGIITHFCHTTVGDEVTNCLI